MVATPFSKAWSESGNGQDPFAIAQYNGKLYFFGQYGELRLNSIDLTNLVDQPDGTLTIDETTFGGAVSEQTFKLNDGYSSVHSESPSASAATIVGANLCLFWNDDGKGPVGSVCDANNVSQTPRLWYELHTPIGEKLSTITEKSHDIAATTLDADNLLIAIQCKTDDVRCVWIGQYQLSQGRTDARTGSNEPGSWKAVACWVFSLHSLVGQDHVDKLDGSLHMDWYSFGIPTTSNDPPAAWLGLTFFTPDDESASVCWIPMDFATPPALLLWNYGPTVKYSLKSEIYPCSQPVTLRRSPSGAMHFYTIFLGEKENTTVSVYTMPGNKAPTDPTILQITGDCIPRGKTHQLKINRPLVSAFLVSNTAVQTTVTGDQTHSAHVGAFPVGEAIFAHANDILRYHSYPFGRVQQVPNESMLNTTGANILAVRGIFDGPFPMPEQNLVSLAGTSASFADVKYGTSHQSSSFRSKSTKVSVGVRSSLTTTKGIGPAWDIEVGGGWAWASTSTTEKIQVMDLKQSVQLTGPDDHHVVRNGSIIGSAMQFFAHVYRFLVPVSPGSPTYKVDPDACQWATMWAAPIGEQALPYTPYSVTPGDITSYTEEAWNATMSRLGYPGSNYIQEVVVANAYPFKPTAPYLEVPVAVANSPDVSFDMSKSDFTESSWSFDTSVYGGISGGGGIDIFGVGQEFQWSVLGGMSSSVSNGHGGTNTTSWGVGVEGIVLPPLPSDAPENTVGVQTFTARLYLLPASSRWTDELRTLLDPAIGGQIDPHSEPWRIVYQVVSYTLTDGTRYPALDEPPVAPTSPTVDLASMRYPTGPGVWESAGAVSYAVKFANSRGGLTGPLSAPQTVPATRGACPRVTVPVDASTPSLTTKRLVYRQIDDGPLVLVRTILDNASDSSTFYDDDPAVTFKPPATLTIDPGEKWAGRATGESDVWTVLPAWISYANGAVDMTRGNQLSYSVSFTFASPDGKKLPQTWSRESMLSDPSKSTPIGLYAYATMSNIPTFPTTPGLPTCTGRNIYRTVWNKAEGKYVEVNQLVGHIPDNTTTTFTDTTN
jgi:hypothetical protein